jgi:hypothetical protein
VGPGTAAHTMMIRILIFVVTVSFLFRASADIRTGHYKLLYQDKYIQGPYLAEFTEPGMKSFVCAKKCLEQDKCKSFNYRKAVGRCQLSGETVDLCVPKVAIQTGTTYYTTEVLSDGKLELPVRLFNVVIPNMCFPNFTHFCSTYFKIQLRPLSSF